MNILILLILIIALNYFLLITSFSIGWFINDNSAPGLALSHQKISIVIAVRNEEKSIWNCLHHILKQDYPKELYEIIIIDDHSEDSSAEIIEKVKQNNSNIRLFKLNDQLYGKKNAITKGVMAATGI